MTAKAVKPVKNAAATRGKAAKAEAASRLRITLVKSTIGFDRKQGTVVQSLGLRRIGHTIEREDDASVRGMLHKVRHLVKVEQAQ